MLIVFTSTSAWALDEDRKDAALLGYRKAKRDFEQHRYAQAAKGFETTLQQLPLPVVAIWAARCHALAGDRASAQALYLTATVLPPNELWLGDKQRHAQAEAAKELEQLVKEHEAAPSAPAPGATTEPGQQRQARAQSGPSPWRTVGWISLSAGGAALAVGAVMGLLLQSRHGSMQPDCPGGICNPDSISRDQVDEHNALRTASTVSLVAAGLLGAAGLTLIFVTTTHESKSEVAIRVSPMGGVLQGAF